ncbi:restriction endonuclease subunit S [Mycoplasmopsis gallinacea]|uniref:Restriction-modification enzyme subunit S1B n=1 Tax=Mycoplasmopsis gallinacea TaxID=29556 RepID=A0A449A3Z8_9BACT|nr:restriction endonuclease subunit S [Mycoplasmopsis gallinacea]VEU58966.1 restriction-modification enzyme subunit S1B [Mycoplasmopsis gallinacea]
MNFFEKLLFQYKGNNSFYKIEDIFDIKNGYTPLKSNKEFWKEGDINWFTLKDIRENGDVLHNSIEKVSIKGVRTLFKSNSLIMSTTATIGEIALIKNDFICNQQFHVFQVKEQLINLINIKFMFFYFKNLAEKLKKDLQTSTFPRVDIKDFKKTPIFVPNMEVQNKIVEILDKFTEYSAELKAELKARDEQYKFYRDKLLSNNNLLNDINFFSKKLSEITEINIGKQPSKEDLSENGLYPYMNGGINRSSNAKNFNNIKNTIIVSQGGSNAGYVQWMYEDFYQGSHCYSLKVTSKQILNRFLFFYLKSNQDKIFNLVQGSGIPGLKKTSLSSLTILIPSIRTQEKIVKVLDNFEAICKDLNIGLPAEEAKRQQQYDFYRDAIFKYLETGIIDDKGIGERESGLTKILSFIFDNFYLSTTIGKVCQLKRGRVISKNEIEQNKGIYPVYSSQTENDGQLGKIDTFDFDGEFVTWTTDGAKAGTVFYRNGKFSITNVCGLIIPDINILKSKYLYYWLSINAQKYVKRDLANAKLMSNVVDNIKIEIPSLKIQEKIVKVLDNFEAICKDLNIGLPSEEVKRQQQYEYYRDAIFKYLETGIIDNKGIGERERERIN